MNKKKFQNISSNKKIIFLFGPPGSGKSTQAKMIAEKFGFYYFATSVIAKEYIASHDDPKTKEQEIIYKKGELLDAKWLFEIIKQKTKEILKKELNGIVYEGSPRTLYEAKNMFGFLSESLGKENIITIKIEASECELKKRLTKRLLRDKNSSHIFIEGELEEGAVCPNKDGGKLYKRDLDDFNIFKIRMREYKTKTEEGINFLKTKGSIIVVNGEQTQKKVFKEILEKIKRKINRC